MYVLSLKFRGILKMLNYIKSKQLLWCCYRKQTEYLIDIFHNIRTKSFRLEHDINGHCIGSSFGYATARDWARLALLYQYDGMWWDKSDKTANPSNRTKRILPEGWVEFTKTPTKTSRGQYGAHFWLNIGKKMKDVPSNMFYADGYQGQRVYILPDQEMVVVRLGLKNYNENKFLKGIIQSIQ